ncbi:MAG: response regulator transcription factor [Candidatus Acidiferrales bacterium]
MWQRLSPQADYTRCKTRLPIHTTPDSHSFLRYAIVRFRSEQPGVPNGILIADDSGLFRKAVRAYLIQNNFEVCGEAIDGNDVLEKANNLQPRLVLLDLRMPHRNGVEVASLLRARMPAVRIVLLTMYDEVLSYKSIMTAIGIDDILPKPDCFKSLAECVQRLLDSPQVLPENES